MAEVSEAQPEPGQVVATTRRSRAPFVLVGFLTLAMATTFGAWKWKQDHKPKPGSSTGSPPVYAVAPLFELPDQKSRMVRLERYVGRHPIILVFFDGEKGADANPWLKALAERYATVQSSGTKVVAITTTLPQKNRAADMPFDVLTDLKPGDITSTGSIHRAWGAVDEKGEPTPRLFLIRHDRTVQWGEGRPEPVADPLAIIRAAVQGSDPESVL